MTAKPKRRKGRAPRRTRRRQPAVARREPVAVPAVRPDRAATTPRPVSARPQVTPASTFRPPDIGSELRTIGILGGLLLAVLVILRFVL